MVTYQIVKKLFDYKNGFLYFKNTNEKAGFLNDGRWRVSVKGRGYPNARIIFLWHNGYLPPIVDHKDRDILNDKIENLRAATKSQNNRNRKSATNSRSKYLGVSFYNGRWKARLADNGNLIHIGMFKTEIDAALAYNNAALLYHKEFANLNQIETKKKTMINITIEGESAFDVRQQIQELLGLAPSQEISKSEEKVSPTEEKISISNEKIAENFEGQKTENEKTEKPAETSKRKTKAEKALEVAQPGVEKSLGETDIQSDNDVAETQAQDNKEASKAITADMLKEKAVELIRNNKKPEVTALVKSFGADSVATADKNPIKPEDYVRFMDELNKL